MHLLVFKMKMSLKYLYLISFYPLLLHCWRVQRRFNSLNHPQCSFLFGRHLWLRRNATVSTSCCDNVMSYETNTAYHVHHKLMFTTYHQLVWLFGLRALQVVQVRKRITPLILDRIRLPNTCLKMIDQFSNWLSRRCFFWTRECARAFREEDDLLPFRISFWDKDLINEFLPFT